jgi:hypothetical protein
MIDKLKTLIEDPGAALRFLARRGVFNWLPDKEYLKLIYKLTFRKKLDLKNPKTFNEKIQWLKLYDRNPEYSMMVDKYRVRDYVQDKIGEEYLIPLLVVWDNLDKIEFSKLPKRFVLKCNHDSGSIVICKDKAEFDEDAARKKLKKHLKQGTFRYGREWPYKDIKPCIIAEQYMENSEGSGNLVDYKIYNFNGIPRVILVCQDRFNGSGLREDFYTEKWEHIPVSRPNHPNSEKEIEKPKKLEEMLDLSRKLSKNISFVRTDFYIIQDKVYFGEMTFFPTSGFGQFKPDKYDEVFGDWITLPC